MTFTLFCSCGKFLAGVPILDAMCWLSEHEMAVMVSDVAYEALVSEVLDQAERAMS